MYELWYYYVKSKHSEKANLCFMDTDSFIAYIKTNNIYKDIPEDVEIRFDISNYELDRRLSNEKHEKLLVLIKDELREKIMKEFV